MTEYYPGSKTPIPDFTDEKPNEIDWLAIALPLLAKKHLKLAWKGQLVQFYTTGDLGYILGRSAQTIRNWETKHGILPLAPCVTTNASTHAKRRLYPEGLVRDIFRIATECGIAGKDKWRPIKSTTFTEQCVEVWEEYI